MPRIARRNYFSIFNFTDSLFCAISGRNTIQVFVVYHSILSLSSEVILHPASHELILQYLTFNTAPTVEGSALGCMCGRRCQFGSKFTLQVWRHFSTLFRGVIARICSSSNLEDVKAIQAQDLHPPPANVSELELSTISDS